MSKHIYFIILFATFFSLNSFGQIRLGLSPAYMTPTGRVLDIYEGGPGVNLAAKFNVSEKLAITTSFGLYSFTRSQETISTTQATSFGFSSNFVEILDGLNIEIVTDMPKAHWGVVDLGVEYYFTKSKLRPYIGGSIGVSMIHTEDLRINFNEITDALNQLPQFNFDFLGGEGFGNLDFTSSDLNFSFSAIAGLNYAISDKLSLDLNGKFTGIVAPDNESAINIFQTNLGLFYKF